MNVGPTATKRSVLEQLLEQGMVLVALDARAEGVDVPTHLGRDPQLRLNLSYRFGLPMHIDAWGIEATLTFAGVPYACRLPWSAIFLLVSHVSGQPYLFPDDIPAELLSQAPEMAASVRPQRPRGGTGDRPKLTLIARPEEADAAPQSDTRRADPSAAHAAPEGSSTGDEPAPRPAADKARRRGHLRLVK